MKEKGRKAGAIRMTSTGIIEEYLCTWIEMYLPGVVLGSVTLDVDMCVEVLLERISRLTSDRLEMKYSVNEAFIRRVSAEWGGTRSRDVNSILDITERLKPKCWDEFFSDGVQPSEEEKIRLSAKLITRCDANADGLLNLESFLEWYRITVDIWPLIKRTVKRKTVRFFVCWVLPCNSTQEQITVSNTDLTWDDNLILAKVAFDDNDEDDSGRVTQEVSALVVRQEGLTSCSLNQQILKVAEVIFENLNEEQHISKVEKIKLCEDLLNYREEKFEEKITFSALCSWYSSIEGKLLGIRALAAKQMVAREGTQVSEMQQEIFDVSPQAVNNLLSPFAMGSTVVDSPAPQQDVLVKRKLFASRGHETPSNAIPPHRTSQEQNGQGKVQGNTSSVNAKEPATVSSSGSDETVVDNGRQLQEVKPPEGDSLLAQVQNKDMSDTSSSQKQESPWIPHPPNVKSIAKSFSTGPIAQLDLSKLRNNFEEDKPSSDAASGQDDILQRLAKINITPRRSEVAALRPPTDVEKTRIEERIDELLQDRSKRSERREAVTGGHLTPAAFMRSLQEHKPLPSISLQAEPDRPADYRPADNSSVASDRSSTDVKISTTSILKSQTSRTSDMSARTETPRSHVPLTSEAPGYTPRSLTLQRHIVLDPENYSLTSPFPSSSSSMMEDELTRFYKIHNPHKLAHVVQLAQRYHKDRLGLNAALRERYGADLDSLRAGSLPTPRQTPRSHQEAAGGGSTYGHARGQRNAGADPNAAERGRGGGGLDASEQIFRWFGVRLVRRREMHHDNGYIAISEEQHRAGGRPGGHDDKPPAGARRDGRGDSALHRRGERRRTLAGGQEGKQSCVGKRKEAGREERKGEEKGGEGRRREGRGGRERGEVSGAAGQTVARMVSRCSQGGKKLPDGEVHERRITADDREARS
eukprot:754994-Hanusia_phi.AAC.17